MPKRGSRNPAPLPGDPTDPAGFPRMIGEFATWMGVHGYSERTIGNRTRALAYLAQWLLDRGVTRPSEVTKPMLDRYQRHLFHRRKPNGEPLSFRTQHTWLVPVRAFFKWAARDNRILFNPASELELPKIERRLPKHVLTIGEAERVLAQPDLDTPGGVRDRAILEVFYATGIRRAELLGLRLFDLDVDRGTLIVRQGKGKRDRMIPIGPRAILWTGRYLDDVRPGLVVEPDGGHLFLTVDGTPFAPSRLTQLVRTYVNAAGIGKTGSCHLFRHTMATLMLEGGADTRYIQQMLGHARLETTQIYTQVSIRQLQAIYLATHPGATNERHRRPDDPEGSDADDQQGQGSDRAGAAAASSLAASAATDAQLDDHDDPKQHDPEEDDDDHDHDDDGQAAGDGR